MRILHLYSDYRWTGPAEPVLQMCKSLEQMGHNVIFACRKRPAHVTDGPCVESKAKAMGVNCTTEFALNRYLDFREGGFGALDAARDILALRRYLQEHKIDVLHTHLSHDHALGALAIKLHPAGGRPVNILHMHRRNVLKSRLFQRLCVRALGPKTGFMVFTDQFRAQYLKRFRLDKRQVILSPMPLDLEHFCANRNYSDQREKLGIPKNKILIGIVARFQKYRRMDLFLEAARKLLDQHENVHFIVIGRSSQMAQTVVEPLRRLNLSNHVTLTGHLTENYADTLATLDMFTLIMPGFDGTARAVREAMAIGTACVVSNFGMLPEIVEHEKSGLVAQFGSADALAEEWRRLIESPELRMELGNAAAQYAQRAFQIKQVGPALERGYLQLLSDPSPTAHSGDVALPPISVPESSAAIANRSAVSMIPNLQGAPPPSARKKVTR